MSASGSRPKTSGEKCGNGREEGRQTGEAEPRLPGKAERLGQATAEQLKLIYDLFLRDVSQRAGSLEEKAVRLFKSVVIDNNTNELLLSLLKCSRRGLTDARRGWNEMAYKHLQCRPADMGKTKLWPACVADIDVPDPLVMFFWEDGNKRRSPTIDDVRNRRATRPEEATPNGNPAAAETRTNGATCPMPSHNLRSELTEFVGRVEMREKIKTAFGFGAKRLITLTGGPGAGKTRLAVQLGWDLRRDCPDGVWFVELAPLSDQQLVVGTIASSCGFTEQAGSAKPLDQLIAWIGQRASLLILDNCEHLLEDCAKVVQKLLHHCPRLRILVTSRARLGIDDGSSAHSWRIWHNG